MLIETKVAGKLSLQQKKGKIDLLNVKCLDKIPTGLGNFTKDSTLIFYIKFFFNANIMDFYLSKFFLRKAKL